MEALYILYTIRKFQIEPKRKVSDIQQPYIWLRRSGNQVWFIASHQEKILHLHLQGQTTISSYFYWKGILQIEDTVGLARPP